MLGLFLPGFLFISTHISLDLLSLGSAEAYIGWVWKLNSHLMASCVRNICTKNYQNLVIGFQVTVKNVGDVFWDTVYTVFHRWKLCSTNNEVKVRCLYCSSAWGCAHDIFETVCGVIILWRCRVLTFFASPAENLLPFQLVSLTFAVVILLLCCYSECLILCNPVSVHWQWCTTASSWGLLNVVLKPQWVRSLQ